MNFFGQPNIMIQMDKGIVFWFKSNKKISYFKEFLIYHIDSVEEAGDMIGTRITVTGGEKM